MVVIEMISADEAIEEMIETRLMICCGESIEIEEPTDSAGMFRCYVCFGIGIGYEKRHENNRKFHHTSANQLLSQCSHLQKLQPICLIVAICMKCQHQLL